MYAQAKIDDTLNAMKTEASDLAPPSQSPSMSGAHTSFNWPGSCCQTAPAGLQPHASPRFTVAVEKLGPIKDHSSPDGVGATLQIAAAHGLQSRLSSAP